MEKRMKHTVIGVFDSYSNARQAEHALIEAGFQRPDITIHTVGGTRAEQAWPKSPSPYAGHAGAGLHASNVAVPTEPIEADWTTPMARDAEAARFAHDSHESRAWTRIEQYFRALFAHFRHLPETAHYREALRRGSALLSVDVFADAQVNVARQTLIRSGAIDLDARLEQWRESADDNGIPNPAPRGDAPSPRVIRTCRVRRRTPAAYPSPCRSGSRRRHMH
jgi:hypothetical protein